jgi:hypothetical protein
VCALVRWLEPSEVHLNNIMNVKVRSLNKSHNAGNNSSPGSPKERMYTDV